MRTSAWAGGTATAVVVFSACTATSPSVPPAVTVTVTAGNSPTASVPPTATPTTSTTKETPNAADWATIVQNTEAAVVRLEVATCNERWMGTGFAIEPHRIVTAAHVAENAVSIGVQGDGFVTTAEVVALDKGADVALLQTLGTVPKVLTLSGNKTSLGNALALLGFPGAVTDLRVSQGIVSGVDASVDYGSTTGISLAHVLATDAAINGGNSGGPAIDRNGDVIGLVTGKTSWTADERPAEGTGYVVPSDQLMPRLDAWRNSSVPDRKTTCDGSGTNPDADGPTVEVKVPGADALDIARSLATHGAAINAADYEVAWTYFTDREKRSLGSFATWARGVDSSIWVALTVNTVRLEADTASVGVLLRTRQDAGQGPQGQDCSDWDITYTMKRSEAAWLIDKASAPSGAKVCTT